MRNSLLIKGGTVIDGTGAPAFEADVRVSDGIITEVAANLESEGEQVIDASGANETVFALASNGTDLYAGGRFTSITGSPASHIAKWNGTTWSRPSVRLATSGKKQSGSRS